MNEDIKLVIQAVKELDAHMVQNFTALNGRMNRIESQMDGIESRMDKVESRLDKIESRLDKVESRIDKLEDRFGDLEANMNAGFQELNGKVDHIADAMEVIRENGWTNSVEIKEIRRKTGI